MKKLILILMFLFFIGCNNSEDEERKARNDEIKCVLFLTRFVQENDGLGGGLIGLNCSEKYGYKKSEAFFTLE